LKIYNLANRKKHGEKKKEKKYNIWEYLFLLLKGKSLRAVVFENFANIKEGVNCIDLFSSPPQQRNSG
jgi:hypothetical protein